MVEQRARGFSLIGIFVLIMSLISPVAGVVDAEDKEDVKPKSETVNFSKDKYDFNSDTGVLKINDDVTHIKGSVLNTIDDSDKIKQILLPSNLVEFDIESFNASVVESVFVPSGLTDFKNINLIGNYELFEIISTIDNESAKAYADKHNNIMFGKVDIVFEDFNKGELSDIANVKVIGQNLEVDSKIGYIYNESKDFPDDEFEGWIDFENESVLVQELDFNVPIYLHVLGTDLIGKPLKGSYGPIEIKSDDEGGDIVIDDGDEPEDTDIPEDDSDGNDNGEETDTPEEEEDSDGNDNGEETDTPEEEEDTEGNDNGEGTDTPEEEEEDTEGNDNGEGTDTPEEEEDTEDPNVGGSETVIPEDEVNDDPNKELGDDGIIRDSPKDPKEETIDKIEDNENNVGPNEDKVIEVDAKELDDPDINLDVNGVDELGIGYNTDFKYNIKTTIPENVDDINNLLINDTFDERLNIVNADVYIGDVPTEDEIIAENEEVETIQLDAADKNDGMSQKEAALAKANIYVDTMHMSETALKNQLSSEHGEGYDAESVKYAIDNVKADYEYNALESAKNYLDLGIISESKIYNQLTSNHGDQFTEDEAQFAIDKLGIQIDDGDDSESITDTYVANVDGQKVTFNLDKSELEALAGEDVTVQVTANVPTESGSDVINNTSSIQLNEQDSVTSNEVSVYPGNDNGDIPQTGASSNFVLYGAGALLVLLAGGFIIYRKRQSINE